MQIPSHMDLDNAVLFIEMNRIELEPLTRDDIQSFVNLHTDATHILLRKLNSELLTLYSPNVYKMLEAVFESLPQSNSLITFTTAMYK